MAPGEGYMLSVAEGSELVYPSSEGLSRTVVSLEEPKVLPIAISSWDVNPHAYEFNGTIDMSIDNREDFNGDYIGVFVGDECRGIAERMEFLIDGSYYYSAMVFSNVTEGETLTFKYYSSLDDEIVEYTETAEFTANMIVGNGFDTFGLSRIAVPEEFSFRSAYPNPFNPITTIRYQIPEKANVSLTIYDMVGKEIIKLVNEYQHEGLQEVSWDAKDNLGRPVSAGIYIYKMKAGEFVQNKKMVLLK